MSYDYRNGKDRVNEILNNSVDIKKVDKLPSDDSSDFTYGNGIRSWVGSIFIDIIGSTELIKKQNDLTVAKILRSFTSEAIAVLNTSKNVRQIGVRGDCVYGIYSTPKQYDLYELFNLSATLCTLVDMLNKLFTNKGYPTIKVGIGVAAGEDLIIKAGQKGTGINDRIWIGNAVVDACNIANKAGRNGHYRVGFSSCAYENIIEQLEKIREGINVKSWFHYDIYSGAYYASLRMPDFEEWIEESL